MPWTFFKSGVKSDVITAVAGISGTSHPGQSDQIARLVPVLVSEVNALRAAKVSVAATGHFDGNANRVQWVVQAVETNVNGEIVSKS